MSTPEGQLPSFDSTTGIESDIKYVPEVQKSHTRKMSSIGEHKMDIEKFGTKKIRRIMAKREGIQPELGPHLSEGEDHFLSEARIG